MNKKTLQQAITKINFYTESAVTEYLKKHHTTDELVALACTLKAWANPDSSFSPYKNNIEEALAFGNSLASLTSENTFNYNEEITKSEIFKPIQQMLLWDIGILFLHTKDLSSQDEQDLLDLLRYKLNQIGNALIAQNHLKPIIKQKAPTLENWWQGKSSSAQEITNRFAALSTRKKNSLRAAANKLNIKSQDKDLPAIYLMCNSSALLNAQSIKGSSQLERMSVNSSPYLNERERASTSDKLIKAAAIILAPLATVTGILPLAYAASKLFKSIKNIFTDSEKTMRSMFRSFATLGGGAGGAVMGSMVGTALGSVFPGVGNVVGGLAGAAVGGFVLGSAGAATGAITSKEFSRINSKTFNSSANNPSNPAKYELTPDQDEGLKVKFKVDVVNQMLHAVANEKKKLGMWRHVPFTAQYKQNQQLNTLLDLIKQGDIDLQITIDGVTFIPERYKAKPVPAPVTVSSSTAYVASNTSDDPKDLLANFKAPAARNDARLQSHSTTQEKPAGKLPTPDSQIIDDYSMEQPTPKTRMS